MDGDNWKDEKIIKKIARNSSEFDGGRSAGLRGVGGGKEGGARVDAAERDRAVGENGCKLFLLHKWADEYIYFPERLRNYPPLTVVGDWLEIL